MCQADERLSRVFVSRGRFPCPRQIVPRPSVVAVIHRWPRCMPRKEGQLPSFHSPCMRPPGPRPVPHYPPSAHLSGAAAAFGAGSTQQLPALPTERSPLTPAGSKNPEDRLPTSHSPSALTRAYYPRGAHLSARSLKLAYLNQSLRSRPPFGAITHTHLTSTVWGEPAVGNRGAAGLGKRPKRLFCEARTAPTLC